MSWNKIRTYNPETMELRRVATYVLSELAVSGTTVRTYTQHDSTFQIVFYNFMRRMKKAYDISPNEILCFLAKHPTYINNIYRRDLKALQVLLIQSSKKKDNRATSFVTLYYDNYQRYGSVFRALLRTIRYPFDKFDRSFIRDVFAQYPFLISPRHLTNVLDKIKEKGYAYYITADGIKEEY